jgi:hypothetical protein
LRIIVQAGSYGKDHRVSSGSFFDSRPKIDLD